MYGDDYNKKVNNKTINNTVTDMAQWQNSRKLFRNIHKQYY